MSSYIGSDNRSIQRSIVNHIEYTLGLTRFNFNNFGAYEAAAHSVRDRMIEQWNDTNEYFTVNLFPSQPSIDQPCEESLLHVLGVPPGQDDVECFEQH